MLGGLEGLWVQFASNEFPPKHHSRSASGAGTHAEIQHGISGIGVGTDQVFQQCNRLFGGVKTNGRVRFLKRQNRVRVLEVSSGLSNAVRAVIPIA